MGIFAAKAASQNWWSFNHYLSHVLSVVAISFLAYFIYCLIQMKEAVLITVRVPKDDPDGQRESVQLVAVIVAIVALSLQYYVL